MVKGVYLGNFVKWCFGWILRIKDKSMVKRYWFVDGRFFYKDVKLGILELFYMFVIGE